MKKLTIGMVAHVDAGKTTLSEAMLYHSGTIRKMGRVDKQNAFLDTYAVEKLRGITVFSKEARMQYGDMDITLMDTPGHVDFSTEMERTLQILDYSVLIINGNEGCQGHTETLWKLLERYSVPVIIFVNKMDMPGAQKDKLLDNLKKRLDENCIDFTDDTSYEFFENIATTSEDLLSKFLENEKINTKTIKNEINNRNIFPCFFGSALKDEAINLFLDGLDKYTLSKKYKKDFGAKVFKITRDNQGNRLTHLKITGGILKVRESVSYDDLSEKINQIRLYNGEKFEAVNEVSAGDICAVTGLTKTWAGQGIGSAKDDIANVLEPVLRYRVVLPRDIDAREALPKFRILQEEDPKLHVTWDDHAEDIYVQLMGDIQIEIIKRTVYERFGFPIDLDMGDIVYKETIKGMVEGVGHFEPLRHYAEVHLLIEEGERGSGIVINKKCSEDILERNWQRLILTHLAEKEHKGVLTGSELTDVKITLVAGRAHKKHTVGGDFRQATYRAVRQGLMEAESILLEPYYDFRMELPTDNVGKAMSDVDKMHGTCQVNYDETIDEGYTLLEGSAPVSCMRGYQIEFASYTKGFGKLSYSLNGYDVCHDQDEVLEKSLYNPEADLYNPVSSVFCQHGSGVIVNWNEVKDMMHVPSALDGKGHVKDIVPRIRDIKSNISIDEEEIEKIMNSTYYSNKSKDNSTRKYKTKREVSILDKTYTKPRKAKVDDREKYLLVDGYNIIFAWDDLNKLADINIDSARDKLIDVLSNFGGKKGKNIIIVFDAYKVKGGERDIMTVKGINIVYTKFAQTADSYIEKFAYDNNKKYNITVATSDYMEQVIVAGQGCTIISARDLKYMVTEKEKEIRQSLELQRNEKVKIGDIIERKELEK